MYLYGKDWKNGHKCCLENDRYGSKYSVSLVPSLRGNMATRNLTTKYQKLRRNHKQSQFGNDPNASDWEQARRTLPPYWVDTVDECRGHIEQIGKKMQDLERAHNKRLRVFTDSEEAKLESEIDIITGQITGLFRKTERNLKRIFSTNLQQGTHDDTIRKNIQSSMAKQLQDFSFEFRGMQKSYMNKLKEKKQGAAGGGFFPQDQDGASAKPVDTGFNNVQLEMLRNYEKDVNQRDQEISAIAKSIEELATIFKELSVLVIDQGTVLDRIDYNMEQVVDKVESGVDELEKAVKYQKSSRPVWCIVFLLIANGVMILLLYFKFKKDDNENGNNNNNGRMLRGLAGYWATYTAESYFWIIRMRCKAPRLEIARVQSQEILFLFFFKK